MQVETDKEKIKTIALGVYNAINKKDINAIRKLFAPEIIRHATAEIGVEAAINLIEKMFIKSPDTQFYVEDILIDGTKAALRVTVHGRAASEKNLYQLF